MSFFFFNDTATTEIYTLSLHDALPISAAWVRTSSSLARVIATKKSLRSSASRSSAPGRTSGPRPSGRSSGRRRSRARSEEHTSELQSRQYLVCRLLLEKKKKEYIEYII